MGSNLLSGKSPLKVSMPVFIFERRTNLERFAQAFGCAPDFLDKAAQCTDKVERLKLVTAFLLNIQILYLTLEAPFNPILGETFQSYINGCPLYFEQVAHHPPICSWILYGRGYRFYGSLESTAEAHMNSFEGRNLGTMKIEFYDNQSSNKKYEMIHLVCPTCVLSGTAVGDRTFNLEVTDY